MNDLNPENAPSSPQQLQDHPVFAREKPVGLMSGANPYIKEMQSADGHSRLLQEIRRMGPDHNINHVPTNGKYGNHEPSVIVYNPTREQMFALGRKYGQESVIFGENGRHELLYTNGPHTGKKHLNDPSKTVITDKEPEDNYTVIPDYYGTGKHGYMTLHFDWDNHHDGGLTGEHAEEAARIREKHASQAQMDKSETQYTIPEAFGQIATALKKYVDPAQTNSLAPQPQRAPAHPHAYDWHDGATEHHLGLPLQTSLLNKEEPPEGENQTAKVGVSTYAQFAAPYGTVDKSTPSNLFHYDYHGKNDAINKLVQDHGYQTYYAGGKHGKPDLATKNYNTKHLMIYDPSSEAGSFRDQEYTDSWRKIHELAHALTYPELNKIYGEGRRIGKLGHHRNTNEALRAVHWEWLAAHKQRELSKQIGIHLPEEDFNKELNTVMHDAAHRAVTGKFTEPSQEGFKPSANKVHLDVALGQVRQAAHNLGLVGPNDLLKKFEGSYPVADEKEYSIPEVRLALAKAMKDRVEKYAEEMRTLRTRELQKSEVAATPAKSFDLEWAEYKAKVLKKSATMETQKNLSMGYGEQTTNPPAGGALSLSEQSAKKNDSGTLCKMCNKSHPEMEKCDMSEVKKNDLKMSACKKCSKSHPEMEKCDTAEVKEGDDSVKKSVASMTVHDSKAAKAPKGADYSSKQVGSTAVYDAKKPGIFGMLEDKKKMQKYSKNEGMGMSEDADMSKKEDKPDTKKSKDMVETGQAPKPGEKRGILPGDKASKKVKIKDHGSGGEIIKKSDGHDSDGEKPRFMVQMAPIDHNAPKRTNHEDLQIREHMRHVAMANKKNSQKTGKENKKPSEDVKKTDSAMGKVKAAAGKVKDVLTNSNQKRADSMPNHGFNKEGKPAYLDKADAPMAKPPSGKNMATATPVASNTSKPGLTKNAAPKLPGMNLKAPKVKMPEQSPTATAQVRANAPAPEQKPPSNEK